MGLKISGWRIGWALMFPFFAIVAIVSFFDKQDEPAILAAVFALICLFGWACGWGE